MKPLGVGVLIVIGMLVAGCDPEGGVHVVNDSPTSVVVRATRFRSDTLVNAPRDAYLVGPGQEISVGANLVGENPQTNPGVVFVQILDTDCHELDFYDFRTQGSPDYGTFKVAADGSVSLDGNNASILPLASPIPDPCLVPSPTPEPPAPDHTRPPGTPPVSFH